MAVVFTGEPSAYLRPGQAYQPTSFIELLGALNLLDRDTDPEALATPVQRAAVEAWLESNEPGELLKASLAHHGIETSSKVLATA